jgi:cyclopropane fatty-acyl-phospholipid synthase-like methyltransferase
MNKKNLAMHYGLWDIDTQSIHEALLNENEYIGRDLDIKDTDTILDAGCGVGGTSIWMAEKFGSKVIGINIVEKQIKLANKYAKERKIDNLVCFVLGDYCNTKLPDGSFDKIFALESVCHTPDKEVFVKEVFRLLKPGGKFCIYDYFINKLDNDDDKRNYKTFCSGWAMSNLAKKTEFEQYLYKNNFEHIKFTDLTTKALKSSKRIHNASKAWLWVDKTLNVFKIVSDENVISTKASVVQYEFFKNGAGYYGSFYAQKPRIK